MCAYISLASHGVVFHTDPGGSQRVAIARSAAVRVSGVRAGRSPEPVFAKLTVYPHCVVLQGKIHSPINNVRVNLKIKSGEEQTKANARCLLFHRLQTLLWSVRFKFMGTFPLLLPGTQRILLHLCVLRKCWCSFDCQLLFGCTHIRKHDWNSCTLQKGQENIISRSKYALKWGIFHWRLSQHKTDIKVLQTAFSSIKLYSMDKTPFHKEKHFLVDTLEMFLKETLLCMFCRYGGFAARVFDLQECSSSTAYYSPNGFHYGAYISTTSTAHVTENRSYVHSPRRHCRCLVATGIGCATDSTSHNSSHRYLSHTDTSIPETNISHFEHNPKISGQEALVGLPWSGNALEGLMQRQSHCGTGSLLLSWIDVCFVLWSCNVDSPHPLLEAQSEFILLPDCVQH